MPPLLSSGSVQRGSFNTVLAIMFFLAAASIVYLSAEKTLAYHANVGVLQYVNPKIGTFGLSPNGNGGMIPSVAPPFAMTRWTPQTRENFISQCPYHDADKHIHGFQATHQPAIWMGEMGQMTLTPGIGFVKSLFSERAHRFKKEDERSTPYLYEVTMEGEAIDADHELTEGAFSPVPGGAGSVPDEVKAGANGRIRRRDGEEELPPLPAPPPSQGVPGYELPPDFSAQGSSIKVAMTASAHVGWFQFDFKNPSGPADSYIFVQSLRKNWTGNIEVSPDYKEISGSNSQRQDYELGPNKAAGFRSYFSMKFSEAFDSYGIAQGGEMEHGNSAGFSRPDDELGAYVRFKKAKRIEVRVAVSFISVNQAREILNTEAPVEVNFDIVVDNLKKAWLEKLGRVTIDGVPATDPDHDPRTIWYTALYHALQYPSEFSEPELKRDGWAVEETGLQTFYSGYTDSVHKSLQPYYQSWSIWDTFRAEHSLLTMFVPERVNDMMRSLVRIYEMSGRLPMWANMVETNIMIGTHVDAVIANALKRGFKSFDLSKAWDGVKKNAFVPPVNDTELLFYDREPNTGYEVRAGLTTYMNTGWVANDRWAESASRTLDYAFDDYAASVVAEIAGHRAEAVTLHKRSMNYRNLFNNETHFMQARNFNGTWADPDQGWTEGDQWIYTFNVMHDPLGLAELMGGREAMKKKLDEYFSGDHNDHTNEPSHHAPYMYAAIGYPSATQKLVRDIAKANYNATSAGLSGNEDLGQMSAWYIFSSLGFYPLNPASDEYVVGSPFFEKVTIRFPPGVATGGIPDKERTLTIVAPGATTKPYVKSVKVNGVRIEGRPVLKHMQIVNSTRIEFEMADTPQTWGEQV